MLLKLLIIFIGVPLIEIAILVKLGTLIGFWPTIFIVIGTGIIGASIAKAQGFAVWRRIQNELRSGNVPAGEMIDGLLILIGGIVLLTPGLLTDLSGFLLLIPWSRSWFKQWLGKKFRGMARRGEAKIVYFTE
ncbi:MAG TPA: FxsA family protein [Thermodesulfobacteriota bacterium]|nr:FxsA family protein [Thermodesulfobacteriota bacterium]